MMLLEFIEIRILLRVHLATTYFMAFLQIYHTKDQVDSFVQFTINMIIPFTINKTVLFLKLIKYAFKVLDNAVD